MDSKRLGDDGHRRLRALVDRFGRGDLAERLGLTVDGLGSILSGDCEMEEEGVMSLILRFQVLEALPSEAPYEIDEELFWLLDADDLGFDGEGLPEGVVEAGPARVAEDEEELGVGGPRETDTVPDPSSVDVVTKDSGAVGETEAPVISSVPGQVVDVAIDQDGKPDAYGIGVSSRSGMSWMEQQERRRMSLRNAHAMATMTQYRIGMTHLETVTALGLVTQIELALITCFRESLPEPGRNWDSQKRAREIERRLARLRWVEQEQEREDSGLKGMWNRVRGRGRPSGKELYERMVKNADTMIMGMQEPDRDDDVLAEALRFTGVGPEDPGYPHLVRRPGAE